MNSKSAIFIYQAIKHLLRPLIRVLLRYSISHSEFSEIAKQVYVDVAQNDFKLNGRKQTISRVSVLTGLNRKEVKRVEEALEQAVLIPPSNNRAVRVVNAWLRNERYLDAEGHPLVLPVEGREVSFSHLVKEFSGDMPMRAVLDELLVSGAVVRTDDAVSLSTRAYVPRKDEQQMFTLLGQSAADLLSTFDHNLHHQDKEPRLQLTMAYDNLPIEVLERFKTMGQEESQALLLKLNSWLAEHDRDVNKKVKGSDRYRAGIGMYYFEHPVEENKKDE